MVNTLPETNIAGWNIHHFDGIYQDFDGDFHGRTVSFREGKGCILLLNEVHWGYNPLTNH